MKNIVKLIVFTMITTLFVNCKKDTKAPDPVAPTPVVPANSNNLNVEFEPMVGDSGLVLTTQTYTNQAGNTFNVTIWKYYVSNIQLTKTDNTVITIPNTYFLVDHSSAATSMISIPNVPYGDYKGMQFTLGVDSARNVSGAQTGALDPANGMFWTWTSGYIMAKMEGASPQSTDVANKLVFHIGGFSGVNNVLKTINIPFNTSVANVTSSISPKIHISSDLLTWFKAPTAIDFATLNKVHMPGANAVTVANNYASMFKFEHVHNN